MPPLFFRCDASPKIGLGHLRRCCVLARACVERGSVLHFLIRSEKLDLHQQDFPQGTMVHSLPWDCTGEEDAGLTAELCRQQGLHTGVVDHYRVGGAGYQEILLEAGLRWMQFGNRLHQHTLHGGWVHDANPGASASQYEERLPARSPVFLAGPSFALVADEFRLQRQRLTRPISESVRSVLVTFGGGDDRGGVMAALDWLNTAGFEGRRVVMTTSLNPNLPTLQQRADLDGRIELHVDNWHPAPLMANCQLALCAGGTSLHELACLGVPPVITCIADNQQFPADAWQQAGMAINLGDLSQIATQDAVQRLQAVLRDPLARSTMAQRCWDLQDGRGAERVAEALLRLG